MSETAAQFVAAFETLSAREQHEVLAELLRRSCSITDAQLSDEHLVDVANQVFASLDAEESDVDVPEAE